MIRVAFFDPIIFVSSATVLPNSGNSSQSQMSAMAQQFGLNMGSNDDVTISSPKLLPDILRSRRLSIRMLEKNYRNLNSHSVYQTYDLAQFLKTFLTNLMLRFQREEARITMVHLPLELH